MYKQDTLEEQVYIFIILWSIVLSSGFLLYLFNLILNHQFPLRLFEHRQVL